MAREKECSEQEVPEGSRMCALTHAVLPREKLIRFVIGPDGILFPDPSEKLPGRGVWITASKEKIQEAVIKKALFRSLKREVEIPKDLPEITGSLLRHRALNSLSLANKAGHVTTGFVQVDALIAKGTVFMLLHAKDGAQGGAEKLNKVMRAVSRAKGQKEHIETFFTVEEMSLALGRSNVVHAALTTSGISQKFLNEAHRMQQYSHF